MESENCPDKFVWYTQDNIADNNFGPITTAGGFGDIVNYIYTELGDGIFPDLDTCIRDPNRYPDIQWVWNNQMFNTMTFDFNFGNLADILDQCCGTEPPTTPQPTPSPTDITTRSPTPEPTPTPRPTRNPVNTTQPTPNPTTPRPSLPPTPANCSCKVDVCAHGMCNVELYVSEDGGITFNSLAMTSDYRDPLELDNYCIDVDTVLRFEVVHSQYVPKHVLKY